MTLTTSAKRLVPAIDLAGANQIMSTANPDKPNKMALGEENFWVALRSVRLVEWGLFFSGYLAWICDALDFFAVCAFLVTLEHRSRGVTGICEFQVSLSVPALSKEFGKDTKDIVSDDISATPEFD
jgi:hypothetical protein